MVNDHGVEKGIRTTPTPLFSGNVNIDDMEIFQSQRLNQVPIPLICLQAEQQSSQCMHHPGLAPTHIRDAVTDEPALLVIKIT